jgi:hypothetical protein
LLHNHQLDGSLADRVDVLIRFVARFRELEASDDGVGQLDRVGAHAGHDVRSQQLERLEIERLETDRQLIDGHLDERALRPVGDRGSGARLLRRERR